MHSYTYKCISVRNRCQSEEEKKNSFIPIFCILCKSLLSIPSHEEPKAKSKSFFEIWWSAKDKILNYIGIRGPLQLVSRTTSGPRSRLWESLIWLVLLVEVGIGRKRSEFEASRKIIRHQQLLTWHSFDTTSIKHWTGIGTHDLPIVSR